MIKRTAFGFRDFDYFFDRIWYAFLPRHKKMEARRKVWECYEMDFSELSAETIEQQKNRMSLKIILKTLAVADL